MKFYKGLSMNGYEVQYFSKELGKWVSYSFNTGSYQYAKETAEYLQREGQLARIITYNCEVVKIDDIYID